MESSRSWQHHLTTIFNIAFCILISLAMIGIQLVSAEPPHHDYYVDLTTDSTVNSGCADEADTDTCGLRGAITLANGGDTSEYYYIHLAAETYTLTLYGAGPGDNANISGDLDVNGPTIIIMGAGDDSTVITQNGISDRIIDLRGTHSLKLMDLVIQDGRLPTGYGGGGGIRAMNAATLTLDNVDVISNQVAGILATDAGGGLFIDDTNLVIGGGSSFYGNTACHGGAIRINNSGSSVTSNINSSIIHYNAASCGNGGGIYTTGTVNLTLSSLNIIYNHSLAGAGYYDSTGTSLTMSHVGFEHNYIDPSGTGAGAMEIFGTASIDNSELDLNTALVGSGAIHLNPSSTFTMTDSRLYNNTGDAAGALLAEGNTSALLQQVEVSRNEAHNGGGISVITNGNLELENVTIARNIALNGGGLYLVNNTSADLNHVTISTNLGDTHGDAVYIGNAGKWFSSNSIFYYSIGGDVCFYTGAHVVGSGGHNISSDASCLLPGGTDLASTDPRLTDLDFFDSDLQTMKPLPGSPAIDGAIVGDPVTTDQRGVIRLDGDGDGIVQSDVGAHEASMRFFLPLIKRP